MSPLPNAAAAASAAKDNKDNAALAPRRRPI
jgi:hypothetical protein